MTTSAATIPRIVISAYGIDEAESVMLSQGLINQTWIVTRTSGSKIVIQCLHPAISTEANARIEAISKHLNELIPPSVHIKSIAVTSESISNPFSLGQRPNSVLDHEGRSFSSSALQSFSWCKL